MSGRIDWPYLFDRGASEFYQDLNAMREALEDASTSTSEDEEKVERLLDAVMGAQEAIDFFWSECVYEDGFRYFPLEVGEDDDEEDEDDA